MMQVRRLRTTAPAHFQDLRSRIAGQPDGQVGRVLDGPVEVPRSQRVDVQVRSGIEKVDGMGDPIAHRPLHRAHVIAKGPHQLERVLHDPLFQFGFQFRSIREIPPLTRIVEHGQHLLLTQAEAADVAIPGDPFLQDHGEPARLVIGPDDLLERMANGDISPAASVGVLEDAGQTDMSHESGPVERIHQVPQALGVVESRQAVLVGQDNRLWMGHAQADGQAGLEKLVVRRPDKGIVDHRDSLEDGILEVTAVVGDLVRDTVDHDGV